MTQSAIEHVFSPEFTGEEFLRRRQTIAGAIGAGASALLQGAPRSLTAHPKFSQSKIFYYVCGISLERCYLLIDGRSAKTTLFVPPSGISGIRGGTLDEDSMAQIRSRMAIDEVLSTEALTEALEPVQTLYVLHQPDERVFATKGGIMGSSRLRAEDPLERHRRRDEVLIDRLRERFPSLEIADLGPIIANMRLIKSPAEIEVMRKTGEMSARVCVECMKSTRPGIPARALEAIGDYVFRMMGNCGHAYEFILEPSHQDSETLLDGDLVRVDCGPDYHYYTMDIARIWPVNGRYDQWQRHTCGLIVEYHKTLLRLLSPGKLSRELYDEAARLMLAKYADDEKGTAILRNMIDRDVKYYNHNVGLSVHDAVTPYRDEPFKAGMVVAVDPMVWLDDAPHGYVRVEDTVLITEDGCESLTRSAPFELDEIEELMKQPGQFPIEL